MENAYFRVLKSFIPITLNLIESFDLRLFRIYSQKNFSFVLWKIMQFHEFIFISQVTS